MDDYTSCGLVSMARRVYDHFMVGKWASYAFGLMLIVALGFGLAHAKPLKAPGASTGFSTPCELVSPAFKATSESKVVSAIDSIFVAKNAGAPTGLVRESRLETGQGWIPLPPPGTYPPLFHRPPPAKS